MDKVEEDDDLNTYNDDEKNMYAKKSVAFFIKEYKIDEERLSYRDIQHTP